MNKDNPSKKQTPTQKSNAKKDAQRTAEIKKIKNYKEQISKLKTEMKIEKQKSSFMNHQVEAMKNSNIGSTNQTWHQGHSVILRNCQEAQKIANKWK